MLRYAGIKAAKVDLSYLCIQAGRNLKILRKSCLKSSSFETLGALRSCRVRNRFMNCGADLSCLKNYTS